MPNASILVPLSLRRMGPPLPTLPSLTCSLDLQEEGVIIVPKEEVLLGHPVDS